MVRIHARYEPARSQQHAHSSQAAGSLSKLRQIASQALACGLLSFRGTTAEWHELGVPMRRRPRLKRPRWRLVLLAVACAFVWLRFYRRSVAAEALLDIPSRWPACSPDGAPHRVAPVKRRAFDSRRLAIISTWLPTRCGIATFSAGLRDGLLVTGASVDVVAVHLRSSEEHVYGSEARCGDSDAKLLPFLSTPACVGGFQNTSGRAERLRLGSALPRSAGKRRCSVPRFSS